MIQEQGQAQGRPAPRRLVGVVDGMLALLASHERTEGQESFDVDARRRAGHFLVADATRLRPVNALVRRVAPMVAELQEGKSLAFFF